MSACSAQQEPKEEERDGADCNSHARQQPPVCHTDASGGWRPSMHLHGASLIERACHENGNISSIFLGRHSSLVGKTPQQKEIVLGSSRWSNHPTDQAISQKEDSKLRAATLAEEDLTAAEIETAREQKKFHQANHRDDCGSGLGPLEESALAAARAADGSSGSATACAPIDDASCSDSAESSEGELERVRSDKFSLHYFEGSSGSSHHSNPRGASTCTSQML